jgi:photosystem II stability/assembly factor-like uncharacterized protein
MRLLIGTRKGLLRLEHRRDGWHLSEPHFLGVPVNNAIRDPRDGSVWALLGHGHWGPKLSVSTDDLKSFGETTCPAFPEGCEIDTVTEFGEVKGPATVKVLYALAPAGADGSYHIGTDPGGLFSTRDGGESWTLNEPLRKHRNGGGWMEGGGGLMLHTILVRPDDSERILIGVSCAGVLESRDGGASWEARNKGVVADFLPDPNPEVGQDTHMLRAHRSSFELLWQQNHCGNYRSRDGGMSWEDVTAGLPTKIGFGLALDDEDPEVAWCIPMDSDERRVAPEGALTVCRTDDGGQSWRQLREGLPQRHCYDIVFRHALDAQGDCVVFGTSCGRLFASRDRGESWETIAAHLAQIRSVNFEPQT